MKGYGFFASKANKFERASLLGNEARGERDENIVDSAGGEVLAKLGRER